MNVGRTLGRSGSGAKRNLPTGRALERLVVITETVEVATFEPSIAEEAGETVHVDAMGAPVQVQVTVWLKPPVGTAETEKFAISPAVMVVPEGEVATP